MLQMGRMEEKMKLICLDLEGVLVPEIWVAFAEASRIPELKKRRGTNQIMIS